MQATRAWLQTVQECASQREQQSLLSQPGACHLQGLNQQMSHGLNQQIPHEEEVQLFERHYHLNMSDPGDGQIPLSVAIAKLFQGLGIGL